jgi:hypothetical protein
MSNESKGSPGIKTKNSLMVEKISVTTDGTGAASVDSKTVIGKILQIIYDKDTVNAGTTAVLTMKNPTITPQLDSYDVNTGDAIRVVGTKVIGSTDAYTNYVCNGSINVAVSGGAASKHFDVYIYYS